MGIFGTKWELSVSFDKSNRELTFKRGFFIIDKTTTFSNIERFRVIANTENESCSLIEKIQIQKSTSNK